MTSREPGEGRSAKFGLAGILTRVRLLITWLAGAAPAPESRPAQPAVSLRLEPAVFRLESPRMAQTLIQQAVAAGLIVTRGDGDGVTTKAEFLVRIARDLDFPDYFGHNWDAFADCLGDFAAAPGNGRLLILEHFDELARASPRDWRTALTILTRAAEERQHTSRPLVVVLSMPSAAAPGIPAIDPSSGQP